MSATFIFWTLIALAVGIILSKAYRGKSSSTSGGLSIPSLKLPKINGDFLSGKAAKLGLLGVALAFVVTYPWLETWGKVTPVAWVMNVIAGMEEEANRNIVMSMIGWLPWVVAGLIAWNILTNSTTKTSFDFFKKTSMIAFWMTVVGATLIGIYFAFFGDQPGGSSSKEVIFNLAQRDSVRHAVGINTPIKVIPLAPPSSTGGIIRYDSCAKIIGPPAAVAANLGEPVERLSSNQAMSFDFRLSQKVRNFLSENPLAGGVTLEFYRRQIKWGDKECA